MPIPLHIVYRDIEPTQAIDAYIRGHFDKLSAHTRRAVSCHVALEAPHRSKHHGRHYRVRIELSLPGEGLVVDRCPDSDRDHENAYAAIDDAFDHALRRVDERARRARDLQR